MSDDKEILSDPDFQEFARHVREDMLPKLTDSTFAVSILTKDAISDPDVLFAVELGFSILLNKPMIGLLYPGATVSPKLAKVFDAFAQVVPDDDEATRVNLFAAMESVGVPSKDDRN